MRSAAAEFREIVSLLLGFAIFAWPAYAASAHDFQEELPNEVVFEEGLAGGGVPSEKAIRIASEKGYKTIIDLRMPEEGVEAEKALVEKHGLRYVNIPTSVENLGQEQADRLKDELSREGTKPAILHCASGNRAAAVWAVYRRFHQEKTADEAIMEASSKGLKPTLMNRLTEVLAE